MTLLAALNASLLILAGIIVFIWVLMRHYFRRIGRDGRGRTAPHLEHLRRPTTKWDGAYSDSAALIDRKEIELYDLARDASARIDNKLILLNHLIAQSQQQIDRMETLLAEMRDATEASQSSV